MKKKATLVPLVPSSPPYTLDSLRHLQKPPRLDARNAKHDIVGAVLGPKLDRRVQAMEHVRVVFGYAKRLVALCVLSARKVDVDDPSPQETRERLGNLHSHASAVSLPASGAEARERERESQLTSAYDNSSGPSTRYSVFGASSLVSTSTATVAMSSADTQGILPSPVAE